MKRVHVIIKGLVQGVFFRAFLKYHADRLKIKGWVKNTASDNVEAVFEGEKENVEAMIKFCHRGPPGAIVKKVEVIWENPTGEFKGFRILY